MEQSVSCSRDVDCSNTSNADSVRNCCVQEGALSYQPTDFPCQLCYGMLNIMYTKCRYIANFMHSSVWMGGRHCPRQ